MWHEFLMLSGLVFWGWQGWRLWRFWNAHYKRVKWALTGYRQQGHRLRHR